MGVTSFDTPVVLKNDTDYIGFGVNAGATASTKARIYYREVDPNGVLTAPIGSLCIRGDAGNVGLYQNTDSGTTWILSTGLALIYDNDWTQEPGLPVDLNAAGATYTDRFGVNWGLTINHPTPAVWEINSTDGITGVIPHGSGNWQTFDNYLTQMVTAVGGPALTPNEVLWIVVEYQNLTSDPLGDGSMNLTVSPETLPGPAFYFLSFYKMLGSLSGNDWGVYLDEPAGVTVLEVVGAAGDLVVGSEFTNYAASCGTDTALPAVPGDLVTPFTSAWFTIGKTFNSADFQPVAAERYMSLDWNDYGGAGNSTGSVRRTRVYRRAP